MDKVFYNGVIRTLDDNNTVAQAVGVKDGKIAFIGTDAEAENKASTTLASSVNPKNHPTRNGINIL